jgi:hypothetical protein
VDLGGGGEAVSNLNQRGIMDEGGRLVGTRAMDDAVLPALEKV